MLKETEEAPSVIRRIIDNYFDGEHFTFDSKIIQTLRNSDDIVFLACGTSHYASLLGVDYMSSFRTPLTQRWAGWRAVFFCLRHFFLIILSPPVF